MDEEQHYARFDTDADFEGGTWIGDEFFYKRKREGKGRQTRDQQLYGVFAGTDSDDEIDARGGERGRRHKKADYSAPVAFVSKGHVGGGAGDEKGRGNERGASASEGAGSVHAGSKRSRDWSTGEEGVSGDGEGEMEGFQRGGLGLGAGGDGWAEAAGSGRGGLGAGTSAARGGIGARGGEGGGDEEDDDALEKTAFGRRLKRAAEERRKAAKDAEYRKGTNVKGGQGEWKDLGGFEKYSKGIGSKLLAKMGYRPGEGLGKKRTGIARAIEVKMRPNQMGLGYAGQEHQLVEKAKEETPTEEAAPGKGDAKARPKTWKRRVAEQGAVKREYRTAEELLRQQEGAGLAPSVTVIDMRGPRARVVTDLGHLEGPKGEGEGAGTDAVAPELRHNITLLVDLAEADLKRLDARLRHQKDTMEVLARERERLGGEVEEVERELRVREHLQVACQQCMTLAKSSPADDPTATLAAMHAALSDARHRHPDDYRLFALHSFATGLAGPLLRSLLRDWDVAKDPGRGAEEFRRWLPLMSASPSFPGAPEDPGCRVCEEGVLPRIRAFLMTEWDVRDPEAALTLVEAWKGAMPGHMHGMVLQSMVLPKIESAVAAWDPRTDPVPLHRWTHPWLPHLGDRLEASFPAIRHQLTAVLHEWHPSDPSAVAVLRPWAGVFHPRDWAALVHRSIMPKLAYALDAMAVNPASQDLAPVEWALQWHGTLSASLLGRLFESHVLPKIHEVLQHWLGASPNYDEVVQWLAGWQGLLPEDIASQEPIRRHFAAAQAGVVAARATPARTAATATAAPFVYTVPSAAPPHPAPRGPASLWDADEPPQATPAPPLPSDAAPPEPDGAPAPLRELLEMYATENGFEFLPRPGRQHEGLPVYSLGGVSLAIDQASQTIRALIGGKWATASLEAVVAEAKRRA